MTSWPKLLNAGERPRAVDDGQAFARGWREDHGLRQASGV